MNDGARNFWFDSEDTNEKEYRIFEEIRSNIYISRSSILIHLTQVLGIKTELRSHFNLTYTGLQIRYMILHISEHSHISVEYLLIFQKTWIPTVKMTRARRNPISQVLYLSRKLDQKCISCEYCPVNFERISEQTP